MQRQDELIETSLATRSRPPPQLLSITPLFSSCFADSSLLGVGFRRVELYCLLTIANTSTWPPQQQEGMDRRYIPLRAAAPANDYGDGPLGLYEPLTAKRRRVGVSIACNTCRRKKTRVSTLLPRYVVVHRSAIKLTSIVRRAKTNLHELRIAEYQLHL